MGKESIEIIAKALIKKHDIDYKFKWIRAKTKLGLCNHRDKTIGLSIHMMKQPYEIILNTLLHEIAHAIKPYEGHNWKWRNTAISIGCNGRRTASIELCKGKYKPYCVGCGRTFGERHKKIKGNCPRCKSKIDWKVNKFEDHIKMIIRLSKEVENGN